jgi:mono/diheme cytochrome c family protein
MRSATIAVPRFHGRNKIFGSELMRAKRFYSLTGLVLTLACAAGAAGDDTKFFAEQVEPLLRKHCFECHSHGSKRTEGGLTLDSRSGWAQGGERGAAIVPGKPAESLLIQAIRRTDDDFQMPPEKKLADEEIETLVKWIKEGATDPRIGPLVSDNDPLDWWSLRPLQRPAVPSTGAAELNGNSIDAFILAKLQSNGLSFSPPASRPALVRRLYINVIGLPPTPAEVEAFVADTDPLAYEKLVDRLLNSPRYGERWARHWLDTVHFADSHGCEHDVFRPNAWRYRDYVISSFNRDTPWDRFIREQLAADHFYPQQPHLTAAVGFVAAGPLELSRAGTAPVTFDYLDRDDIVAQVMAAFASSTANCARCHDHKFDPISQEDYYSLQAVFAGGGKGDLEFDVESSVGSQRKRWGEMRVAANARDASRLLAPEFAPHIAEWERQANHETTFWEPLIPHTFTSTGGGTLKLLEDHSLLATDVRPETDVYVVTAELPLTEVTAIRLEVMSDESLPMGGPGRCDNGNLHLSEFEAYVTDDQTPERRLTIRQATADWNQDGWTIAHALDGNPKSAWGIYPRVGQAHQVIFELAEPLKLGPNSQIAVHLKQLHGGGHLIGRLKLHATSSQNPASMVLLPDAARLALQSEPAERTAAEQLEIATLALGRLADRELAALPSPVSVYGWSTTFSHAQKLDKPLAPKVVNVLRRGDIDQPGKVAVPGALSAVASMPARFDLTSTDDSSRRAALADWLAAKENPLTWRSAVNRMWAFHFGRGLCDTPNDFGRMGGVPSHPELLDWLAIWFRDDANGSLKTLHREILNSRTWRQQIVTTPHAAALDADNRLLGRMTARSVDAETFRDSILQISGRVDMAMGGEGIQQFTQSKGQQSTPKLDYDAYDWAHPSGARRSIYRVVWRGIADPFMESLDFPDLGLLTPNREYSVSALQALTMFNNDFVLFHSQALADQLQTQHPQLDDQIVEACRRIFLRAATPNERVIMRDYADSHGLAALCRILINSNEFMFVR